MAKTYVKEALHVLGDGPYLSLIERRVPEGASQTFPAGSPLKLASGLAVVFVAPSDAKLAYWAVEAAHNTTGAEIAVLPALSNLWIEANFLGSAAADNVLAAADFGAPFDLATSSTLIRGTDAGWYIQDSTSSPAVNIVDFRTIPPGTSAEPQARVGDTNARVKAIPMADVLHWDT